MFRNMRVLLLKKDSAIPLALLLFMFSMIGFSCSGGDSKEDGPQEYSLNCSGGSAVRTYVKDGFIKEKGPVVLPGGKKCDDIADSGDKELKKLKRTGEWSTYYSKSKKLMSSGSYDMSSREGTWTYYDQDGSRVRSTPYVKNKKEGEEISYFPGSNNWKKKGVYQEDLKTGTWQEKGEVRATCITTGDYIEDKKEGFWKECSLDQSKNHWYLSFEGTYHRDLKDGQGIHYHPNGKVLAEGLYRADFDCAENPPNNDLNQCGKRKGPWKVYHDNGVLAGEGNYDASSGYRTGVWKEYYRTGSKMAMGSRDHTRIGLWNFWDKRGNLLYQFQFDGKEFNPEYAFVYENGQKIMEGRVGMGLIQYDSVHDELKVRNVTEKQSGNWIFYENGQKVSEGELMMGRKQGEWKELIGGKWVTKSYMMGRERK